MNRRDFNLQLAALGGVATLTACATQPRLSPRGDWKEIESSSGGRLGVAVLHASGEMAGQRLDERFPMCSTFKWLAAACALHRVDAGQEQLDRRVTYAKDILRPHSPRTAPHAGGTGMTIAQLCEAAITVSDNTAGNLLLASFGGPDGLTRYARSLGDEVTRLDRWETELNEATPGDPRDTTTPRAMALLLQKHLLGSALSPSSREQLTRWMLASETNARRFGAGVPAGWRVASKTGGGGHGSTNDVGVFFPPKAAPIVAVSYLTESASDLASREAALARIAVRVTRGS